MLFVRLLIVAECLRSLCGRSVAPADWPPKSSYVESRARASIAQSAEIGIALLRAPSGLQLGSAGPPTALQHTSNNNNSGSNLHVYSCLVPTRVFSTFSIFISTGLCVHRFKDHSVRSRSGRASGEIRTLGIRFRGKQRR